MKEYEVNLPYFKQGTDLANCMENTNSDVEALRLHAEYMRSAADILDKLAMCASDGHLKITCADTHFISVEVNDDYAKLFLEERIIFEDELLEEEDKENDDES